MRQSILFLIAIVLLLSPSACREQVDLESLEAATMAVHDEAMVDLSSMNRVKRQLKSQLAALDSLAPQRDSILDVLVAIEKADADMMDWMANYKKPGKMPAAEAKAYLEDQKLKIEKNGVDIRTALERGQKLLQE
jgi:hypothetical protein